MNKTIYLNIKGGLGNQLFQYAFFLYLKKNGINNIHLFSNYNSDSYGRNFFLDDLIQLSCDIVTELPLETVVINSEDGLAIINYLKSAQSGVYLIDGYFQNNEYVSVVDIFEVIKLGSILNTANSTTAIHIRRGDYGHHGLLPVNYYLNALSIIGKKPFVIYTDEPNFCKYYFSEHPNFIEIIQPNLENPIGDFLKLCKHETIVMANSSFSWMASKIASGRFNSTIYYPSKWTLLNGVPGFDSNWQKIHTNLFEP